MLCKRQTKEEPAARWAVAVDSMREDDVLVTSVQAIVRLVALSSEDVVRPSLRKTRTGDIGWLGRGENLFEYYI